MSSRTRCVLIVDDDDDIRTSMAEILESEGYEVATAEHGRAAIEILSRLRAPPAVVLLDLMMPVMSGPEFLAFVAARKRYSTLPIVVVSAQRRRELAGRHRFLLKPIADDV